MQRFLMAFFVLLGLWCRGALADLASAGYVNEIVDALRVQSDWNQTDSGALDYIKNKPEIPSVDVVNNLAQVVGNDTTGLVKSVADLQTGVSEINNSLGQKENVVNKTQTIDGNSTAEQYPSAAAVNNALGQKADVDDVRFNTIPTTQPSGTPPAGHVFIWFN